MKRNRIAASLRHKLRVLRLQMVWLGCRSRPSPNSPCLRLVTDIGSCSLVSPKSTGWKEFSFRCEWQSSAAQCSLHHHPLSYLSRQLPRYAARYSNLPELRAISCLENYLSFLSPSTTLHQMQMEIWDQMVDEAEQVPGPDEPRLKVLYPEE